MAYGKVSEMIKENYPCLAAMHFKDGKCTKFDCKFNHDPAFLARAVAVSIHKLTRSF